MKLFVTISIFFIASCIELNVADDAPYIYSLNQTFKMQVFIPYYSYFTMNLQVLPTDDLIVSNTSFTTFNLNNGTLSSDSNRATYYLKNQTGTGYPSYILKRGQAGPSDASIFRASRDTAGYGRFISPEIQGPSPVESPNGWIVCNTTSNVYTIGWETDTTSQPREGCIDIAKYSPGVLLHVGYV